MSKVKSDKIPHYELMYLISNKYSENELDPIKEKVAKLIGNRAGVITYTNDLGKKRLAYAIKGFRYGYYQLVEFDLNGAELLKLETDLKLDTEILRHQIVRKVAMTAEQMKAEAEIVQKRLAALEVASPEKPVEETKATAKEETKAAQAEPAQEAKEEAKPTEEEVKSTEKEAKVEDDTLKLDSDKELDSKLDNILSSDLLYK